MLGKNARKKCWEKMLGKNAGKNCWEKLLGKKLFVLEFPPTRTFENELSKSTHYLSHRAIMEYDFKDFLNCMYTCLQNEYQHEVQP